MDSSDSDRRLFGRLVDELDRIEPAIDPYADPDLQHQWSLCIGDIIHQLDISKSDGNSGNQSSISKSNHDIGKVSELSAGEI